VRDRILRAVAHAAEALPAQGPISVFIHHNTLHAFEDLPFEEAVVAAGDLFGCEPFMPEEFYRAQFLSGRIRREDLREVVATDLGERAAGEETGLGSRGALRIAWLEHGVPAASGESLSWILKETEALETPRSDLSNLARERLRTPGTVRALWEACLGAALSAWSPAPRSWRAPGRHRDAVLSMTGEDPDDLANPLMIRLSSAYLDEGIAAWPMPGRERGFFECVTKIYGRGLGPPDPWMRRLRAMLREERAAGRIASESLERSLLRLGVEPTEWPSYLTAAALVLRGWAGMMRYIERRADRIPMHAAPATLLDYLAVRLLADRAAAEEVLAGCGGAWTDPAALWTATKGGFPAGGQVTAEDRAWPLFHLAQIAGRDAAAIAALDATSVAGIFEEIERFDEAHRRRLLHLAYERKLRHEFYDVFAAGPPAAEPDRRPFQAIVCIDEREESFRRHLEEVAPACETFGAAGYFGVAAYHRTEDEAGGRALCPGTMTPEHTIVEVRTGLRAGASVRNAARRAIGRLDIGMAIGGRDLVRGTIGTAALGALAAFPLLLRVLSPKLAAGFRQGSHRLLSAHSGSVLLVERSSSTPAGFTVEEMASVVERQIEEISLAHPAGVVLVIGHKSSSLNNPHESAHDCGACGGSGGGVNARAFALMANHPEVRRALAGRGGPDLDRTWFVGAEHDTASDSMEYFDVEAVPESHVPALRAAMTAIDEARRRNAHERCRRFQAAPPNVTEDRALAHVEARSVDLAQTRPEYGHATNAFCVVGRRARTRGVFLDRRAFLVSYDPTRDDADRPVLARILAAVVPVVAGISLEYYFSFVDSTGYGCGTKLPHNVAALVGVMDGHASDLRTGLPHQMVEIHEPVRLTLLVEVPCEALLRVIRENPSIRRLVSNRWLVAAALDPLSGDVHEIREDKAIRHMPESRGPVCAGVSADWYRGRREFLDFARLGDASRERRT